MKRLRRLAVAGMLCGLGLTGAGSALAQSAAPASGAGTYPDRPIRIVIGFAAGGGTDAVLRSIAGKLSESLGVSVIVDNKPGANGNIANDIVAKAPPDGYTLVYNTSSMVLSPYLYSKLTYNYETDLTPIALTANIPLALVVPLTMPVNNMAEFVAYMKQNPDKVNYASAGTGNVTHLATIQMLMSTGTKAIHVPYRSEAPALTDVMGGQVQFYLGTANALIPLIRQGRVRPLAVGSLKRMEQLPDVPTISETILPGVEFGAWSGFMAPAKTPPEIIAKLNAEINKALADPALRAKIMSTGAEVRGSSVDQYAKFLKSESRRWGDAVKAADLKPE